MKPHLRGLCERIVANGRLWCATHNRALIECRDHEPFPRPENLQKRIASKNKIQTGRAYSPHNND